MVLSSDKIHLSITNTHHPSHGLSSMNSPLLFLTIVMLNFLGTI